MQIQDQIPDGAFGSDYFDVILTNASREQIREAAEHALAFEMAYDAAYDAIDDKQGAYLNDDHLHRAALDKMSLHAPSPAEVASEIGRHTLYIQPITQDISAVTISGSARLPVMGRMVQETLCEWLREKHTAACNYLSTETNHGRGVTAADIEVVANGMQRAMNLMQVHKHSGKPARQLPLWD